MGSRTQDECILHFVHLPIEEPYLEDPEHGAKGGIGEKEKGTGSASNGSGSDNEEEEKENASPGEGKLFCRNLIITYLQ